MGVTSSIRSRRRIVALGMTAILVLMAVLQAGPAAVSAAKLTINFDDITAPCSFGNTVPLTDEYAAMGVTFSGPSANVGGAVLNDCGDFGVSGHSSPNFLALNATISNAIGPETIAFATPTDMVSMLVGSRYAGSVTLTAFNGATQIAQSTLALSTVMTQLSVAAPEITSVVVAFDTVTLVVDDLTFGTDHEAPVMTMPDNFTTNATGPTGAVVDYQLPTATDNEPGDVTVDCVPPPGATFSVGTTPVNCTATDLAGNVSTGTFTITVVGAGDLLGQLRSDTIDLVSNPAAERALVATIDKARTAYARGNTIGVYFAMLTYVVQLDRYVDTRAVSPANAMQLISDARAALDAMM